MDTQFLKDYAGNGVSRDLTDDRARANHINLVKHDSQVIQQQIVEEDDDLDDSHQRQIPSEIPLLESQNSVLLRGRLVCCFLLLCRRKGLAENYFVCRLVASVVALLLLVDEG